MRASKRQEITVEAASSAGWVWKVPGKEHGGWLTTKERCHGDDLNVRKPLRICEKGVRDVSAESE